MASSTRGKTTKVDNGDAKKKMEYKFRYNPSRDKAGMAIGDAIAFIILVVMAISFAITENLGVIEKAIIWVYVIVVLIINAINALCIYQKTFNIMTIQNDEIIFNRGWMTKSTTTIPAHKIRSCTKSSTWLQRKCKTMTIQITTAGDLAEIFFENIQAGERAFQLISKMAQSAHQK